MPPQAEGPPQVIAGWQVWSWTVGQMWQTDTAVMGAASAPAGGHPPQVWMPPQTVGPPAVAPPPPQKSWVRGPCMNWVNGFTVHPL